MKCSALTFLVSYALQARNCTHIHPSIDFACNRVRFRPARPGTDGSSPVPGVVFDASQLELAELELPVPGVCKQARRELQKGLGTVQKWKRGVDRDSGS